MSRRTEGSRYYGMRLADAHCHMELFSDPKEAAMTAKDNGVELIITAGTNKESNIRMINGIVDASLVFGVAGISPDFSSEDGGFVDQLEEMVRKNRGIVGIGEIGLDGKMVKKAGMELQRKVFIEQIDVANRLSIPIVVHSRGKIDEVKEIVVKNKVERAVFHFFEGSESLAKELASRGYLISIPPLEYGRMKRIINYIDLSNIVAETDSPVVGRTPFDVLKVAEKISEVKGIGIEEVCEKLTENIKNYFYI